MTQIETRHGIIILYLLAGILFTFTLGTFLYQYVAALGSLNGIVSAFGNDRILTALGLSLSSAFVTTILAIFLGVPMAYVFAMKKFPAKRFLETLVVDVPQTFPPIAEGMIFLLLLGPNSPLHVNLAFTFAALVIAKFFISSPFVVSYSANRFRQIKKSGINMTARTLGANPFQVFTTILIPMSLKEIAAGASLCWARCMGELGGSLLFAGAIAYKTETIPTFIATQATTLTAAALAATLLVTTASALALTSFKKLTQRGDDE